MNPGDDSGLRAPGRPHEVITYGGASDSLLFEVARLVVAAEIAKIHTIEWTTQLLYNEPLFVGMNSNWSGLEQLKNHPVLAAAMAEVSDRLRDSADPDDHTMLYSAVAVGPGIFGLANRQPADKRRPDEWDLSNPLDVNGGINHFGGPFTLSEEFVSIYRMHPLVPDLLEFRQLTSPNEIQEKVPVIESFRGKATRVMRDRGLTN